MFTNEKDRKSRLRIQGYCNNHPRTTILMAEREMNGLKKNSAVIFIRIFSHY